MGIFSLTDFSERGGGWRGKRQFVSQGFFRLFLLPPKTNKLNPPPAGVTENPGDRENVVPKSGRLRTPGFRGAGAPWRPQLRAASRGPPTEPSGGISRALAGQARGPRLAGVGVGVLPRPTREGHIPPYSLCARPADPLPSWRRGLTSRGRPEGEEASWGSSRTGTSGRGVGLEEGHGPESAPPRARTARLRDGTPINRPRGLGLPHREAGVTSAKGSPEWNGMDGGARIHLRAAGPLA